MGSVSAKLLRSEFYFREREGERAKSTTRGGCLGGVERGGGVITGKYENDRENVNFRDQYTIVLYH